jgi:RNA polymerase sigma-70 factor, ECF subfamily
MAHGLAVESKQAVLGLLRERILRFAASRISRDMAEDVTQDTLVLLTTKYADVSELEDLVPLAFKIVRFKILEFRRKAWRRGELAKPRDGENASAEIADVAGWALPDLQLRRRELSDRLEKALRQLTGRCRDLFRLKLEGHRFAEIQRRLGARTLNTVYTWDARCRARLLVLMGGSWDR